MPKFDIEVINVIRGSSDGILRKFIRSCIHLDDHVIGDLDMLEVSGTMEWCFDDVISNLKKDVEINFPEDVPVSHIFHYLYYAEFERSWGSAPRDIDDDDEVDKNLEIMFDMIGVELSSRDFEYLSSIPDGGEPFDGFVGYRVKIAGEEHLVWRRSFSLETYKLKITKSQMLDEYTRARGMIQK